MSFDIMVQASGLMNRILKIVRSAVPDTQLQLRPEAYGSAGIRHFLRDVIAMANAASDREVSLSVACSNGEYHVFSVTPSGAGEHDLVSVLTGLSIGETLQGRTVTHAFSMGGNNSANFSSPIYFLNGSGVPIGSVTPNDPAVDTGLFQTAVVPIALNTRVAFRTDA